jgi:hypothetical protein
LLWRRLRLHRLHGLLWRLHYLLRLSGLRALGRLLRWRRRRIELLVGDVLSILIALRIGWIVLIRHEFLLLV